MRTSKAFARGSSVLFALAAALMPLRADNPVDLGATPAATPQTVSIIFKVRNQPDLERYIANTVDPSSFGYRRFMNTWQFAASFGPQPQGLYQVFAAIKAQGITVNEIYDSTMVIRATGTTAQFNALLATQLHDYWENGRRFQRPNCKPTLPKSIADIVLTVAGLDTSAAKISHLRHASTTDAALGEPSPAMVAPKGASFTGIPGSFTVGDVANLYNINPLYQQKVSGKGKTIGIATLASFDPTDAYAYWQQVGLTVDPKRITVVALDGGTGTDGADETTLDVEQSGGLAPDAKIVVYEGPNTDSGFLDVFYKAISDNRVDSLSASWGETELYLDTPTLQAYHQAFMEAAAQGIPVFVSSGDEGAFDLNNPNYYPIPFFSPLNSVDHPASDPYVTACGGITLPVTIQRKHGVVVVPQERAWGWDYFKPYMLTYYDEFTYEYDYAAAGGGGGVSVTFPVPYWQHGLAGAQLSPKDYSTLYFYPNVVPDTIDTTGGQDLLDLPIGFRGRNVPDVSLNADPYTGYLVYFGGGFQAGWGGTSFVAPQLNGIAALLGQTSGGRLGTLNPQFYRLFNRYNYGTKSPFLPITAGDNQYWPSTDTYNPATGLGKLDVTALAKALGH